MNAHNLANVGVSRYRCPSCSKPTYGRNPSTECAPCALDDPNSDLAHCIGIGCSNKTANADGICSACWTRYSTQAKK